MTARIPGAGPFANDSRARAQDAWELLLGMGQAFRRMPERVAPSRAVPLTLICGFLGAGKTTLVNRLLAAPGGNRIAVVVNDFGAVGIDTALVRGRSATTIDLANGCICCALSGSLANTLADLLARPDRPDVVVIEASGVAEPQGIAQLALAHRGLRLSGIVTLADAETLDVHLADPVLRPTVARQIAGADIVLLNKADLAGWDAVTAARGAIAGLAPRARVVETIRADVPADVVLGVGSRSVFVAESEPAPHRNVFTSFAFESDTPLDDVQLCAVMGDLPASVIRAKGIVLAASDRSRRFILQVVGRRWSLEPDEPWTGPPRSEIVAIAVNQDAEVARGVLARLKRCEIGAQVDG